MTVYHPRVSAALWLVGMALVGALGFQISSGDWLETGFLALLPKIEQNPEVASAVERHNRMINRKVIWLSGAVRVDEAIKNAGMLEQRVQDSGLFGKVTLQVTQDGALHQYRRLFAYRYQLLDANTRRWLETDPRDLLDHNLQMLYSPVGQMQSAMLERDPLLLFSRYLSSQNPLSIELEQNVAIVRDGQKAWALLIAELEDSRLPLDKLDILLDLVSAASSVIEEAGGELLVSGLPLFTAHGAESARQEITTVGVGSSAGIFLLFLFTFRSIRPLLLSAVAIVSGLASALVVSVWVFGKIHIITLVFGASLIGVVDDYAQHYLCDSFGDRNWSPRKGLAAIFPALFVGLTGNLLSYAGLGFSPFPGLQEVALFSGVGLLAAWLTVVWLFPLLLTRFSFSHEPGLIKLATMWERDWPCWANRHRRLFTFVFLGVIFGGIMKLTVNDDVRLLQSASPELMQASEKIRALLPVRDSQFFLVSGNDIEEWHRNERQLLGKLDALSQSGVLKSYEGLSRYWPAPETQRDNYRILKQTLYDSGLAERYMAELGFDRNAVKTELAGFDKADGKTLALTDWLSDADESRRALWLGCERQRCSSIVALSGIKELGALAAMQKMPGAVWVDHVEQLSSLFERYRIRASLLLCSAFFLVLTGLSFKFGWRGALTVMSVPLLSALSALAMVGWFNQLFSLFNLFALLLVLGIGVDYAAFFYLAGEKRLSTSLAVTLSGLTTLLSFGLLAVSSTEIVHAFGFTVAVGIVTAMLAAPLIVKR
ncbi:MAG: MMPL family transporter [Gammaproteobacteria bacterium]